MPAAAPTFTITYDATPRLLVGRWTKEVAADALYAAYTQLLTSAPAHDRCRFWLLDIRPRTWHWEVFAHWFCETFAPQVVAQLGAPVFVAYVASEEQRILIESPATAATLQQAARAEFYPYFFTDEASAREWLAYYQTHPDRDHRTLLGVV